MPRKDKWKGAAAWSTKEARAGDRLPYLRLIDESTMLLRDGSVMTAIQVPGLLFETEDSDALNAHAATREVVLRSTLDARFVLYHHVIRRRVSVELEAQFPILQRKAGSFICIFCFVLTGRRAGGSVSHIKTEG